MSIEPVSHIQVGLDFGSQTRPVGRLARHERRIYFEFDSSFIETGLEISPITCALKPGVQTFDPFLFEGLPGVFSDSLPDGWGRLLLDRHMRSLGVFPEELSPLDRLAHVGTAGMGALVYEPDQAETMTDESVNIDALAEQARRVLSGEAADVLGELLALNGSSAGARPKAVIGLDRSRQIAVHGARPLLAGYDPWLVKFPNTADGPDAGAIEFVYALMARDAGLDIPDFHLFPSRTGAGFFSVRRFDRQGSGRLHMHSACGILHSDFRTPSLDYEDLMALTMVLTRDIREAEKMFRLAAFNVLAHNRDDHAKNFSFLMNKNGEWRLSPAYDVTFSSGPRGEQSTMVMGEGRNPGPADLIKLGREAKLPEGKVSAILEQTMSVLSGWPRLASEYGVTRSNIDLISARLRQCVS